MLHHSIMCCYQLLWVKVLCFMYNGSIETNPSLYPFLVSFPQLLLCSLYEIYQALEEALDNNSNHPSVAPIYFPLELARLESVERDLEHFYGQDWREKIVVPAATKIYAHRLRQVCIKLDCSVEVESYHNAL